ncbi:MAG: LLM class flavin-dependent oxidoreductase [Chloroflexi bacterium]|nr:LLM class flavin-dependent oxidoreductase [Chloroflexota bacterium]
MRFGTFHLAEAPDVLSPGEAIAAELRQIVLAEDLGFDSVWLAEHHFTSYCVVNDALSFASHVAAVTSTVRIGTAVSVLPLHHPVEVAERATLVDILSNGRLLLGVGRGYSATEFSAFGLDLAGRRERFEESLDIVLKAWKHERFDHEGKFWQLKDVALTPRPLQTPHPQVLVACSGSSETLSRVAARGLPLMFGDDFLVPGDVAKRIEAYRAGASAAGLSPEGAGVLVGDSWIMLKIHISESRKEARRAAGPYALWRHTKVHELEPAGSSPTLLSKIAKRAPAAKVLISDPAKKHWADVTADDLTSFGLFGTPDDVAKKIEEFEAAGARNIILSFGFGGMPEMMVRRSMKRFATEVAPAFTTHLTAVARAGSTT